MTYALPTIDFTEAPTTLLVSKTRGCCVFCGAWFAVGTKIAWWKHQGSAHETCWLDDKETRRLQAAGKDAP